MTTKIKVTSANKPSLDNLDLLAKLIFERINAKPKLVVVESKQEKK